MAREHLDGPRRMRGEIVRYQSMGGDVKRAIVICKTNDDTRNRYAVIPIPENGVKIDPKAQPLYIDGIHLWSDHGK